MYQKWEYAEFADHVCPNVNVARQTLDIVLGLLTSNEFDNNGPLSMEGGPWLAGGSLRRLVERGKDETDFDLFFQNEEQYKKMVAWLAQSQQMGFRYSPTLRCEYRFTQTFTTDHITNYKLEVIGFGVEKTNFELKVQLIHGGYFHETAERLVGSFDFTICQLVTDGKTVLTGRSTLYDIVERKLVVNELTFPVASLKRVVKYSRKGYNICNGEATKFLQIIAASPNIVETRFHYVD